MPVEVIRISFWEKVPPITSHEILNGTITQKYSCEADGNVIYLFIRHLAVNLSFGHIIRPDGGAK